MRDAPDLRSTLAQGRPRALRGEDADPDHPFRAQRIHEPQQVAIARRKKPRLLVPRQVIWGPVAPACLEEEQRAVVRDVVARKKKFRRPPMRRHRPP